ncbi:type II toxin-antitoxin system VapC family toxin [Moraxella lacunata]|uniref:type II toxin-antitoxin system VapC family toxin n=1 Tax=Moraxella lacunata TaxID=477 RepID=UPI003EE1F4D9
MYLLDNNVISELKKIQSGKINIGVMNWIKDKPKHQLFTCDIVIMELYRGVLLKARKDPIQGKHLKDWFDNFVMPYFHDRILSIDHDVSLICANFHVPNPRAENDTWIASIAKHHDMILVTRNEKDFANLPITVINPFI